MIVARQTPLTIGVATASETIKSARLTCIFAFAASNSSRNAAGTLRRMRITRRCIRR
jgi:hypothetical protein